MPLEPTSFDRKAASTPGSLQSSKVTDGVASLPISAVPEDGSVPPSNGNSEHGDKALNASWGGEDVTDKLSKGHTRKGHRRHASMTSILFKWKGVRA